MSIRIRKIFETHILFDEGELHRAHGTVALFGDHHIGNALILFGGVLIFLAHQQDHQVSILFDGAGFTQIRKLRFVVLPGFHGP